MRGIAPRPLLRYMAFGALEPGELRSFGASYSQVLVAWALSLPDTVPPLALDSMPEDTVIATQV